MRGELNEDLCFRADEQTSARGIGALITLNLDRAISNVLSQVSAGDDVSVLKRAKPPRTIASRSSRSSLAPLISPCTLDWRQRCKDLVRGSF